MIMEAFELTAEQKLKEEHLGIRSSLPIFL